MTIRRVAIAAAVTVTAVVLALGALCAFCAHAVTHPPRIPWDRA